MIITFLWKKHNPLEVVCTKNPYIAVKKFIEFTVKNIPAEVGQDVILRLAVRGQRTSVGAMIAHSPICHTDP